MNKYEKSTWDSAENRTLSFNFRTCSHFSVLLHTFFVLVHTFSYFWSYFSGLHSLFTAELSVHLLAQPATYKLKGRQLVSNLGFTWTPVPAHTWGRAATSMRWQCTVGPGSSITPAGQTFIQKYIWQHKNSLGQFRKNSVHFAKIASGQ